MTSRMGVETVTRYAVICSCCGATLYGYKSIEEAVAVCEEIEAEDDTDPADLSVVEYDAGEFDRPICVKEDIE